ncbi:MULTISPECIES: ogr/Delta-like zinc finger family protein [Enterobacter]|uniref:Transcriptional regulator n=1 Tax=Enterobacter roggenkampii TaxID=1812935 RepID=A0ABD7H0Z3_9ENTR|nr:MULTISPECIES: ogr/Delta-like zinc finger family protein [Enterobacter]MBJ5867362.1 ogr/Delta-like zinc finger family protein [Salmonella enterica subsp. enterica serovar Derby]ELW9535392.1 ogr/Delta-like zinc finger family protein [Enterobacter roggenkampii]MDQ2219968.1 ogr/Delta-like zinc finger family protein [Enterobacter roggenkampii]PAO19158.1 transcriptional regulator [Enterobacter roggenkampii]PJD01915.1 transcriptional regulator [Enterobacter roggenkampii]
MRQNRLKSRHYLTAGERNMRVLKIECPECGSKAVIRKTNRKHRQIADIYCACADVECGHTFVMNLTFSHTLSPSAKTGDALVQTLLKNLSPDQKQMALDLLKAAPAA